MTKIYGCYHFLKPYPTQQSVLFASSIAHCRDFRELIKSNKCPLMKRWGRVTDNKKSWTVKQETVDVLAFVGWNVRTNIGIKYTRTLFTQIADALDHSCRLFNAYECDQIYSCWHGYRTYTVYKYYHLLILRFSDCETNCHSDWGIRFIGGKGTCFLLNNDTCLRTTLSK